MQSNDQVGVDWFWEGNVQQRIAEYLETNGWTLLQQADTASRQRGVDLLAKRDDRTLVVEVKGYPASGYQRGPKKGQPKPTAATLQARHWYSHALLSAMVYLGSMSEAEIALGFPDTPRYRGLLAQTEGALRRLGIGMYLVAEHGDVLPVIQQAERKLSTEG